MNQILRWSVILLACFITNAYQAQDEQLLGGCEVTFELFGYDTLCSSGQPFNVPPGLPFGGTYSGFGMELDFFNPSLTGPGEFEITYTYDDGVCSGSATAIMTVIPAVGLEFFGRTEICLGDTVILTTPGGQEYTWENGLKNDSIVFIPDTSFTSYATGLDAGGCQSLTYFDITVNEPPMMIIDGPDGICLGETVQYSVTGADSWIWYNGSAESTIEISPTESLIVSVTSTLGTCDTTATLDVLVQPYPQINIEYPPFICLGDSLVLAPTGADLYRGPFGFFETTQTLFPTASTNIIIDGFNEAGCQGQFSFDIEVRELPEFTLSYEDSICFGNSALAEVIGGANYIWTDLDSGTEVQSGTVNSLEVSPLLNTNYRVEVYGENECRSEEEFHVEVLPLPSLEIEQLQPACTGEETGFVATGASSYEWNNLTNDNPFFFTVTTDLDISLIGIDEYGCTDTTSFFMEAHPTPVVAVTGTPIICEGESSLLTANGADFYVWPDGSSGQQLEVFPTSDTIVMLNGSTIHGCVDFTNYQITVRPAPDLVISGEDTLCAGGYLELFATSDFDFEWSDGTSTNPLMVQLTSDSVFAATSVGSNGCVSEVEFYCHVRPFPLITIEGDTDLCSGETTTLTASGPSYIQWLNHPEGNSITVTPLTPTNYFVAGEDDFGCEVVNPVPVAVHQMPVVYFAFSADTTCDFNQTLIWQANPPGGMYSGDGVVDGMFYPSEATIGLNTVTYAVTSDAGCVSSISDEVYVEHCVGVEESQISEMTIYPNPAEDHFFINCPSLEWSELIIYDARGRLKSEMKRSEVGNFIEVNAGLWTSGLYEIVIVDNAGNHLKKSIIIR